MPPVIKRLQVEEGFLAGLDLHFSDGLNVIIGPRGSGKTSIIELLRFCIGGRGATSDSDSQSREHASSILGSGRVTATVVNEGQQIVVSRSANEDEPRISGDFIKPLIFSQAEIERIGLESRGRLAILDGFAKQTTTVEERTLEGPIRSYTIELRELGNELDSVEEQIENLAAAPAALDAIIIEQQQLSSEIDQPSRQQAQLERTGFLLAAATTRLRQLRETKAILEEWRGSGAHLLHNFPSLSEWPSSAGDTDPLHIVRSHLETSKTEFSEILRSFQRMIQEVETMEISTREEIFPLEESMRTIRKEVEFLRAGAGEASRRLAALQEQVAHLHALQSRASHLSQRIDDVRKQRLMRLRGLQQLRDDRYSYRADTARSLNELLAPRIMIRVEQGGDSPAYVGTIQAALRGSGLHYNTLASQLAEALSPYELAEAVESGDHLSVSQMAHLPEDRAAKVVAAIARSGTEDIVTAQIHDQVTMYLLDGNEFKPTTALSTGQRCTVVLSILLGFPTRGLVIDQPEDHLDNAFIVDTLISAIRNQKPFTQMIFTTHNPNIPVLGDANKIFLMGSDGQRGFEKYSGPLDSQQSVQAITTVMEGGRAAFEQRARFYRDRPNEQD